MKTPDYQTFTIEITSYSYKRGGHCVWIHFHHNNPCGEVSLSEYYFQSPIDSQ